MDITKIEWRNDSITRQYVKRNAEKLANPETMTEIDLGAAATYCKTIYNPFNMEVMRRSGLLEAFRKAHRIKDRREILDKAYHRFNINLY